MLPLGGIARQVITNRPLRDGREAVVWLWRLSWCLRKWSGMCMIGWLQGSVKVITKTGVVCSVWVFALLTAITLVTAPVPPGSR